MANDTEDRGGRKRRPVLETVGGLTAAEAEAQNRGTVNMQQHPAAAPPQVLAAQGLLDMSTRAHAGGVLPGGVRMRPEHAGHIDHVLGRLRLEKPGHRPFGRKGPTVAELERALQSALHVGAPDGWTGGSTDVEDDEDGETMAAPSPTGAVRVTDEVHGERSLPGLDHLLVPPEQFNGPPPASPEMTGAEPPAPLHPGPDGVTGSPPVVPLSPAADSLPATPGGVLGGGGGKADPDADTTGGGAKKADPLVCPECGAGPFGSQRGLDGHMGAKHKGSAKKQ